MSVSEYFSIMKIRKADTSGKVNALVTGGVYQQAKLRLILSAFIACYLGYINLHVGIEAAIQNFSIVIGAALLLYSLLIFAISRFGFFENQLRYIGMTGDILFLSTALFFMHDLGAALYPVYFWIILANGIRFGTKYLDSAVAISAVSFSVVLISSPYWSSHREFGMGLLLGLVIVPIYLVKTLLNQLNKALSEASAASEAKSAFLANISHELRTPLTGIVASADLLMEEPISDEARKKVSMISNAAQSQMTLINDLLDFSKAESGKVQETRQISSLEPVIQRLLSVAYPQAKAKNLDLEIDIQDEMKQRAWFYPQALQQVFINLVGNAVKFTSEGSVCLQGRSLIDKNGVECWRFEVIDTGIGIKSKAMETIFDPFVQADESVTRKFGGTGLGTAISKQLVEMMGGEIGCSSVQGEGSVFWFEIPVDIAMCDSDEAENENCTQQSNILTQCEPLEVTPPLTVLVADDNQTNRDILEMILVKEGHNVTLVSDGLQALEALQDSTNFDLVILDRNMPEIDGLTVMKFYKENATGLSIRQPRFMLITADGTEETRELAIQSGVDSFMTKPVRPHELINTINAMFIILDEDVEKNVKEEVTIQSSLRLAVDNTGDQQDSPAEIDEQTVVDYQKLAELDELSEGLAGQMITGFVKDGDRLLVDFSIACETRDLGQIFSIAHAIKGAALQLGAQSLADYCKQLKTLKRIDLDSKADKTLKDMRFLYLEARNQLLAHGGSEQFQTFEGRVN